MFDITNPVLALTVKRARECERAKVRAFQRLLRKPAAELDPRDPWGGETPHSINKRVLKLETVAPTVWQYEQPDHSRFKMDTADMAAFAAIVQGVLDRGL